MQPNFKQKKWRSKKYLDFVRSIPCAMCGRPADDPHHLIGMGGMGGTGTTAPDWTAIPLCRGDHNIMHTNPELWPDQWEMIARTLGKAIESGVLDVKGRS